MKKRLMLLILLSAVFVHVGQVQAYDGGSGSSDSGSSTSDSGGFGSDSSDSGGFGSDSSDSGGFGSGSSDSGGFGSSTSDSGGFSSSTSDSGGFGSSSSDSGSFESNSSDSGSFGSSTSDSGSFGSSSSDSGSFGSSSSDSGSFGSGSSDSGSYDSSTSNSDSLGFSDSGSFSSSDSNSFGGYSTSDNDSLGISTSNSSLGSSDSSGNWSSIGDSDLSNGSGRWSSIGDTSSSKDNSDFSSFGDAISSGNNYSSGSWSSISDGNTSSADLSAGNWTSTNDSVAKKSSEISDSFSDFDTGNWSRTSDTLADNASSTSKTVSDFTSGDWSRVSDSSSDKFSTSGLGLNDFTAGDWSHVSDFSDNKTSTSAAYSDLEVDNWSRINDSFNNSASSTITATDDFTTGDWTRVTDALGSQFSNKRNSLSDLALGDWASVQDAASRTASLSPLEGEYTLSATKPTEDFVSTSPVNQWSGFNPVEGDWKQIDISEKSKTVNTPTMSEALADWAGFKQTTTSKEGLPGSALDYASSLSATGKNQLPDSFLDGDWQRVSESKPTSTLFNNPLATEDILTNQTLPTTVDLGLSQTFSRTPEDYYQAGAMFAGPVVRTPMGDIPQQTFGYSDVQKALAAARHAPTTSNTVSAAKAKNAEKTKNPNMWGTDTGKPFSKPTTFLGKVGEGIYDEIDGLAGKVLGVSLTEMGTYTSPNPQPIPDSVLTPTGSLNYNTMIGTPPVIETGVIKTSETGARYGLKVVDSLFTSNIIDSAHIGFTGKTLTGKDAVPDSSPLPEAVGRIAIIGNNAVGAKKGVEPLDVIVGMTGYNPITGKEEDRVPSLFGISKGVKGGQKGASEGHSNSHKK